jgi:hypothetical protein
LQSKGGDISTSRSTKNAIDLDFGYKVPNGRIYNLSESELGTLIGYIEANLATGLIQRSLSLAAATILFAK